jgi:hypothetical protein
MSSLRSALLLGESPTGGIDETRQIIVDGCFCCNTAFFCDPGWVGLSAKLELLCVEARCCFKPSTPRLPGICIDLRIVPFQIKAKLQKQIFCVVFNFSLPPDREIPCTLAKCGISVYPRCGICQRQGALQMTRI